MFFHCDFAALFLYCFEHSINEIVDPSSFLSLLLLCDKPHSSQASDSVPVGFTLIIWVSRNELYFDSELPAFLPSQHLSVNLAGNLSSGTTFSSISNFKLKLFVVNVHPSKSPIISFVIQHPTKCYMIKRNTYWATRRCPSRVSWTITTKKKPICEGH